jgi:replicative DNA helicase
MAWRPLFAYANAKYAKIALATKMRYDAPAMAKKKPSTSSPEALLERVPPHSLEAEMSLLGAMMLDQQRVGEVLLIVRPDDFYQPVHRQIAEVLIAMYDARVPIDLTTVNNALKERGWQEEIGGAAYLGRLAESVPSAANAESYARIVKSKAMLRSFIGAAGELIRDAYAEAEETTEFLDRVEESIFKVTEQKASGQVISLNEVLKMTWDEIGKAGDKGGMTGIATTRFFALDDILGGFQPGEMIVLAARPSVGKTALAMNFAEDVAATAKVATVFFSLEMRNVEIAKRMLSARAGVNAGLFSKNPDPDTIEKVQTASKELGAAPLFIDDNPGQTILNIRAKARRLKVQHDIQLIIIDYLQLLTPPRGENRQVQVAEISRGVKSLARELKIPVLVLSQLNREVERADRKPRLSDIRESGAVEQDADVVMLLHRFDEKEMQDQGLRANSTLIVAKNRNGPTGEVLLNFQPEYVRFVPADLHHE